ncbi:DDE-type integrase/transposase/recombinase [Pontibacillus yanchengensis]|uniref:DDE-type integrase/transposase/recombinase n=1 Tax=Pontibacillus yanchengensis TaxID=462910 RepID=A0ACC7VIS6_9BACI|nr:Mu transposase C-terminal domain-containing protein [Pontibacillus yanchengensis]MYL54025.1 DDE-type integrase/transposase/recombinase [Pontibacillus yanchengensis]
MITTNSVYQWQESGEKFRILWINPSATYAFVIDMENYKNNMPYEFPLHKMHKAILLGEIYHIEDPIRYHPSDDKEKNRYWEILKDIVTIEPAIYQSKERYRLIEGLMSKYDVSDVTLYKKLKRYWKGGMSPAALLDGRKWSGGKGEEKISTNKKVGRKNSNKNLSMPVTEEIKKQINASLKEHFFNREGATLKFAYDMFITKYYSQAVKNDDGTISFVAKENHPTQRQFHYWAKKLYSPSETIKGKKGEKRYQKDHRGLEGSSIYEAMCPGSRFEIDSTIGNVYLVSEYNREEIIGRPTIYLVVDVYSRMIVGFYVGNESSSSWFGAIQALVNTIRNKKELCEQYGIQINENEWPTKYFPKAILADKGEFIGYNSDLITQNFRIRVENTSSYRADLKGTVEKMLNLIPESIRPFLPGHIEPDHRERGGKDYRLEAKLTIREYSELIIEAILHYNKSFKNTYPLTKEMIKENLKPTPINLWNWGINENPSNLIEMSPEEVYYNLLPRKKATVTHRGIEFKGARYICDIVREENWLANARNYGSFKVDVSYDTRNTNKIYLHYEYKFIECLLLPHQEKYMNVTFDDLDSLRQQLNNQNKEQEEQQLSNNVGFNKTIQGKVEEFTNQPEKESPKQTKKERVENILENKKEAKNQERRANPLIYGQLSDNESDDADKNQFKRKSILELGLFQDEEESDNG